MTNKFLGLTKKSAQNLAENMNLIFRLIKINGKDYFPYPEDQRDDRLCVEIENDVVIKAILQ